LKGVPEVEVIADTKIVQVPPSSIFNPDTRVYTPGIWDGTWASAFTTDPAWIINDAISDELSGLARFAPGAHLNKWDALEASKWFSELVPDGAGGEHPRYSLNVIHNQPMKAEDFIRYLAGAVGGMAWDDGSGEWRMKVDKPETPVDIFTLENIEGEFTYSHTDVDTRYNDYRGTFLNEEFDFREETIGVVDNTSIALIGHKPTTIALIGCTNRQEALRRLKVRLRSSVRETKIVNFTTNRRADHLVPLDVILIADADLGDQDKKTTGRIVWMSADRLHFQVRDPLRLEIGVDYNLRFAKMNADYEPDTADEPASELWRNATVVDTRTVANTSGQRGNVTDIYLSEALPADASEYLVVALEADGLTTLPKQYRILSLSREDDQDNEHVTVSAVEIDVGKWDAADAVTSQDGVFQDLRAVAPPPLPPIGGGDVVNIVSTPSAQGFNHTIIGNWTRPLGALVDGFRVIHTVNGGTPQVLAERLLLPSFDLVNPPYGEHEFRIHTITRTGVLSAPLIATITVDQTTLSAADIAYGNGETIESLQPAAAGADPTGVNISAGIFGQGDLATEDFADWGTQVIGAGKPEDGATRNVNRGAWAAATAYLVGDLVQYNGNGYIVNTAHTSGGSFDASKFTLFVSSGATGPAGLNVATVFIFKRSASAPTLPSATATYTFATGGLTGLDNGWTTSVPAGTNPVYVAIATAGSTGTTDTIAPGDWATPVILAQNGTDGSAGAAGLNNAVVYIYQRAASAPTLPSASTTYTFATGGLTGLNNGWTTTIPAGTNPLYVALATASNSGATDTIAAGEWTTPQVLAQNGTNGTNGLNVATVYLYQRAASAPAVPSTTATYTFATGVLTGHNNGWTQTVPAGSNPLYVIMATASNTTATDTIATGEWATPAIMAQDGSSGSAGLNSALVYIYQRAASAPTLPSATTTYTFATGGLTGLNNGWTRTIPAGTSPLYVSVATASANTATDTIAAGEWASAVILAQNGTDGTNGTNGLNVATVFLYKRAASAPAVPTTTSTFTFSTGVLTGHDNGWTQTVPAGSNPLYVITATAASSGTTDTIPTGEWASPTILAQDGATGASGLNVATVYLYKRATTSPAVPTTTSTYTFATGALTGHDNGWTQTIPVGTDPLYITFATAASSGTTDTLATGEWTTPVVLAYPGNFIDLKFIRSVSEPTTPTGDNPSGWYDSIPTGTDAIWMVSGTKKASGTLIGTWSTPERLSATTFRGAYDPGTTYYQFDTVTYNGGTYIASVNNFSAHAPSGTDQANAYWDVTAAPGGEGAPGDPPAGFSATINLTSSTGSVNLRTVANANGYTGASDATITFNVPNGVTITGLGGAGIGIDTGTWPTGSYTIALTLVIQSGGIVRGGGGTGGAAVTGGPGGNGGAGGDAIYVRLNMTGGITINSGGTVQRGGGGGGAGGGQTRFLRDSETGEYVADTSVAGGAGGGGFPNGSPGGTTSGGGTGGSGTALGTAMSGAGGNGGGASTTATGGSAATGTNTFGVHWGNYNGGGLGAPGFAVRKNGNTVTVTNNGTMTGSAA
jgi:hypothetical protein